MKTHRIACGLLASLWLLSATCLPAQNSTPQADNHTVSFEPVLGLTYIEARINGSRPLHMVLDTGASFTVLKPEIAAELGLKPSNEAVQAAGQGKGTDETLHLMKGISVTFAGETLTDQTIATLPVEYIDRQAGKPTDGILGGNIFASFVVHEDYAAHTITLIRPEKFVAPEGFTAVPLTVAGTSSLLHLQLEDASGEKIDGTFLLDSGLASGSLFLMKPFVDAHPALQHGPLLAMPKVTAVGGDIQFSIGRLKSIGIGPFLLAEPVATFSSTTPAIITSLAGILGSGVLKRFDVIFDYPHSKLWLQPNAESSKPFLSNASGLQLEVTPPEFGRVKVRAVIPESPAARAGVQVGDVIVARSHQSYEVAKSGSQPQLSLVQVSEWLQEPERNVYLRIERGGKLMVVHFVTKELI